MTPRIGTVVLSTVAATLLCGSPARAQCNSAPLTIQVQTTGTYTNTCTLDPVTNHWNVTVTVNGPVTSNSTVTIKGANTLLLGKVTIQNNSAIDTRVNILGSGFDQRIGGVGFIDKGTSAADRVLLLTLNTVGDVGYDRPGADAIRVDMIANLSVGGNVIGAMVSEGYGRTLTNVNIQGDLRGGISLGPNSSMHSLWVGGNFGMPNEDPVHVYVSGNILNLTAAAINADITTLANSAAGTVHSIDVTTGSFKGSLRAHRLGALVDGAGPAQLRVAGDLDASLTITRDIRVPCSVGGMFKQSRTVAGAPVANAITANSGLFDDPAAAPTSNVTITGDFAGSMVLGVPLSAGLSSVNRDLIVNGAMTGTVSTAQDIDANITVNGPMSGRIDITGSLRAGKYVTVNGPMTGTLSVGGSLLGGVNVPSGGLQGQIVINAANSGGVWSGQVSVGGVNVFSPIPYYLTPSSSFGGGAVAVAPFKAHLDDCTPTHNSAGSTGFANLSSFSNPASTPVLFRAYGPMQPAPGLSLAQAVAVEQQVGANWVIRSSYFNIAFSPSGPSGRVIALSSSGAGTPPAGQYRLRAVNLQSAGVAGSPAVVWPVPFLFRLDADCNNDGQGDATQIAANPSLDANQDGILDSCQNVTPTCPCDYNHSGSVTVQDVFDFLAGYFTTSPMADFNLSGSVTIQDIFDFLGCYFSRPSGC
jgi:hypothetical protein